MQEPCNMETTMNEHSCFNSDGILARQWGENMQVQAEQPSESPSQSTSVEERIPLVSVGMTAYNHEKYIARALDSVLMQEVDFPYEIVIGEDCSQDKTREIILEYQKKYPHIIKPILYEHNVGMKQNYLNVRNTCRGKYRTTLEGDDYWLTTSRMKSQVDFLEHHPEYIAICAKWITLDEREKQIANPFANTYFSGDVYTLEAAQNWKLPGHTCTMMYRNLFLDYSKDILEAYSALEVVGDRKLSLFLALHGPIFVSQQIIAARRIIRSSGTSYFSTSKRRNMYYVMYHWTMLLEAFAKEYYGVQLDYQVPRIDFWKNAVSHWLRLPCRMHYEAVRNIYRECGQKKRYRRIVWDAGSAFLRKRCEGKNVFSATWLLMKKSVKVLRRMVTFHRRARESDAGEKTSIKNFA